MLSLFLYLYLYQAFMAPSSWPKTSNLMTEWVAEELIIQTSGATVQQCKTTIYKFTFSALFSVYGRYMAAGTPLRACLKANRFGASTTLAGSLFHSRMVLGKKEYWQNCVRVNICWYLYIWLARVVLYAGTRQWEGIVTKW